MIARRQRRFAIVLSFAMSFAGSLAQLNILRTTSRKPCVPPNRQPGP